MLPSFLCHRVSASRISTRCTVSLPQLARVWSWLAGCRSQPDLQRQRMVWLAQAFIAVVLAAVIYR